MNQHKVTIYTNRQSLLQLNWNKEFISGKFLKGLIKNAKIVLMISEENLDAIWKDTESDLYKFCEAHDISKPSCDDFLSQLCENNDLFAEKDSTAIWMVNLSENDCNEIKKRYGIWIVNTNSINDDYFRLYHQSEDYEKDEIIKGTKNNGFGNYLETSPKPLPPLNSIVLNDRFLFVSENPRVRPEDVFNWGAANTECLLDTILPDTLRIPFHLLIYCEKPNIDDSTKVEQLIKDLSDRIKSLRQYSIEVEFVFSQANHKRFLRSNYFSMNTDLGFNAFYQNKLTKLRGENDFLIQSYHNEPLSLDYHNFKKRLKRIYEECINVLMENEHNIITTHASTFHNRLFS
jgi:RNAse (barnase) inhibitor barstar